MKKLLFVMALIACSFGLNAIESHISVSGYLSNQDGDAVSNATISSSTSGVSSTSSDKEGFYMISVPASKQCTIQYSHSDYQTETRTVNSSTDINDLDVTLFSSSR